MAADLRQSRRRFLIAGLMALATVCFLWGSFAERSSHHDTRSRTNATIGSHTESGESAAQHANEGNTPEVSETEYRPLGVNLESNPMIIGAAVVSFGLAGLVVYRPRRTVLLALAMVALGFVALEIAEVVHQADIDKTGLLVIALIAGLLHAAVAAVATATAVADFDRR